jgi:hypothetical protein
MLIKRLERRTLKYSQRLYRNPWFLVAKKEKGAYRLIIAAIYINKVIIYNANMPPNINKFSKEFTKCIVASLLNIFLGYNQALLALKSRDLTAF